MKKTFLLLVSYALIAPAPVWGRIPPSDDQAATPTLEQSQSSPQPQSSPQSETDVLAEAVKAGDIAKVRECLMHGTGINAAVTPDGKTPLIVAAENDQLDTVKFLLDNGADIDKPYIVEYPFHQEHRAVYMAAQAGNEDIVEYLLAQKAQSDGVLDVALNNHHADVFARALCSFHYAVEPGDVEDMIERAATINDPDITLVLVKYINVVNKQTHNLYDKHEMLGMALVAASGAGNIDVIKLLLKHGASVKFVRVRDGRNALMEAADKGHFDCVQVLKQAAAQEK